MSSVHPGQIVTEINLKFYKGLKVIEVVLASCDVIILDKLDKTVKINIFLRLLAEISTLLHIQRMKITIENDINVKEY